MLLAVATNGFFAALPAAEYAFAFLCATIMPHRDHPGFIE
jgi:hypothetical protein